MFFILSTGFVNVILPLVVLKHNTEKKTPKRDTKETLEALR